MQSPHKVDVLTETKRLVEAVAIRVTSNHQAGAGHVRHGAFWDHEGAVLSHIERTEVILEVIAQRRTVGPANPGSRRRHERVFEGAF
jgi:hypothetical protein